MASSLSYLVVFDGVVGTVVVVSVAVVIAAVVVLAGAVTIAALAAAAAAVVLGWFREPVVAVCLLHQVRKTACS